MKQILIEIDARCARDLERVAPTKQRRRAEFIRRAIRSALDLALDGATEAAYRARPLDAELSPGDLRGWDAENELARPAPRAPRTHRAARVRKRAA